MMIVKAAIVTILLLGVGVVYHKVKQHAPSLRQMFKRGTTTSPDAAVQWKDGQTALLYLSAAIGSFMLVFWLFPWIATWPLWLLLVLVVMFVIANVLTVVELPSGRADHIHNYLWRESHDVPYVRWARWAFGSLAVVGLLLTVVFTWMLGGATSSDALPKQQAVIDGPRSTVTPTPTPPSQPTSTATPQPRPQTTPAPSGAPADNCKTPTMVAITPKEVNIKLGDVKICRAGTWVKSAVAFSGTLIELHEATSTREPTYGKVRLADGTNVLIQSFFYKG